MKRTASALIAAAIAILMARSAASAQPSLVKVSHDPFTNSGGQHRTEVEPDTVSFGNTIVAAFQAGRNPTLGSSDIGWATSLDGGVTWRHGFLPGITKIQNPANTYDAVSDPAVAFDAAHGLWLIASLPLSNSLPTTPAMLISRSSDGLHWLHPVPVAPGQQSTDKNWITCDDTASSPFYGHCYVEWDSPGNGDTIMMSTSTDGGRTWSSPKVTLNFDAGLGGQPLVQPNGTVIVPIDGFSGEVAFQSTDGGKTWKGAVTIAQIFLATDPGSIRSNPLPSASMDASGRIYVAWEDCRFRVNCSSNDIVYSSSTDGVHWSSVSRVPIDPTTSSVDHFDPGFGVEPGTSGPNAVLGVTFYYFSNVNCTTSTCQLGVGFIGSTNAGQSWNSAVSLAGPMKVTWLPTTEIGYMVGDYISTAFVGANAFSVVAVAKLPQNGLFDEAMYAPVGGLAIPRFAPQFTSMFDVAHPDYRHLYHWRPVPPKKTKTGATIEKD